MIRSKLITTVAAAALMAAAPLAGSLPLLGTTAAQAQTVSLSFNLFFDELEPHGVWVRHSRYRYVWCPTESTRWAPYTRGSWVYLRDRGWYFQSDEPYAWAVYHYGRWYDDERLGWCWVPGSQWAPSWVSWRRGGDYVGWAPLPPEEDGFQISLNISFGEPERDDWFFVPVQQFSRPNLWRDIIYVEDQPDIYQQTTIIGTVNIENNYTYNYGPPPEDFETAGVEVQIVEGETTSSVEGLRSASVAVPDQSLQVVEAEADAAPDDPLEEEAAVEVVDQRRAAADAENPEEASDEAVDDGTTNGDEGVTEDGEATDGQTTEDDEATTTEGEDAVVEGETDVEATVEGEVTAEDCVAGEKLIEGECVPVAADDAEDKTPVENDEAADDAQQGSTEATDPAQSTTPEQPTEPVQATEATPATEPTQPAEPAAQPAEPAQATEPAPAAEEVAPEPAPAPEEAVPAEEPAGPTEADCLEQGLQLIDGVCVPVEAAPAQEEAPAQ